MCCEEHRPSVNRVNCLSSLKVPRFVFNIKIAFVYKYVYIHNVPILKIKGDLKCASFLKKIKNTELY